MPLATWRSYAPKIRKKPKSDFREYIRAETFRLSRETEYCDSHEQSREVEEQTQKKEEIDEKKGQEIQEKRIQSDENASGQSAGHIVDSQNGKEREEVSSSCSIPRGTPPAGAASAVEHNEIVNLKQEKMEVDEVKLRPPIEVYEALDDEIEQHLQRVKNVQKSQIRKRLEIQSSGSVSSEERRKQSSSSGSSRGNKGSRKKNDGKIS